MGITIKDAPLVEQLSGDEKIPISDGSNEPKTVNIEQIKEFANKDIEIPTKVSEFENDSDFATSKEVEDAISKIPTPDVSGQIASALVDYVKKVEGKGLSTNDFTNELKTKLEGITPYDPSELEAEISKLETALNTLVGGNASNAIESFNEIISFLKNVSDTESLSGIIAGINARIAEVEGKIPTKVSELDNDKGYLNEHQDISHLATKEELEGKQDLISDLANIRKGAAKGSTAIQEEQYKGTIAAVDTDESVDDPNIPSGSYDDTEIKEQIANLETEVSKKADEADTASKLSELGSEVDDFKKTITNQVNNYRPIEINGNVTNAADEEDLTSDENNLLKLKNRNNLNGMGYVILRKNKSFSEQLTQTNTIYEIRYNFDLNNLGVNIPEGCVLKFNGGSIENGKIVGDNTIIDSSPIHIFNNIELSGRFGLEYYVEWFGASNKILNNEVVFNHAITQINKTSSGGVLFINGRYVISDTVYLRNGVSLKGVFTLDAEYQATPIDGLKGAALLFNFNDTSKWVIDTFTYQKDTTEQGIIDAKTLHVTYEGLGWGHIRKAGWLIEDISIQAYKANTDAVKYCIGGIRLGQLLHSVVSRVYIYDVAVGICINIAWGTTIKDSTIIAYYIGLYAGHLVTDINVNNCVINRTYYGNSFYVEDKPNFYSTNTIPPYVDNITSCAIVAESSGTDSTKIHLQDVIAQLYQGFLITNGGNVYASNLYLEGINDFIAWTYSGKIVIESIKYSFKKTNNYTFGTNTGKINSNEIREVRCYSPTSNTIDDNRYTIDGGYMWYDDYTIVDGVATPIKKCPVKQIKMSDCNTYYIGYYTGTKHFDYNYSELASGENINSPTTFTEIVNRRINNVKLVPRGLTDMANVEIINSEYTILPSVNSNYPKRLYQSKPIVLKDSKLILSKNDKYQIGFATKGNYDKNLDGKTYDVTQITHTFEVEGNCELSFSAYISISESNEGYAPIKLIGTRPINLKVYLPHNYYSSKSLFLNLDYTTRYHIEVFYPNGNIVTLVNTTKPMNGNKIGDTWIEDGKPIYWTGTKWVDATGTDV